MGGTAPLGFLNIHAKKVLFRDLDARPKDCLGLVSAYQVTRDHEVDQGSQHFVVFLFGHDLAAIAFEDGQDFRTQAILEDLLVLTDVDLVEFGQELEGFFSPGRNGHDGAPFARLKRQGSIWAPCDKGKRDGRLTSRHPEF